MAEPMKIVADRVMKDVSRNNLTYKKVKNFQNTIHVGEEILVPHSTVTNGSHVDHSKLVYARVVAKYPNFISVTNGRYRWSVSYVDLIKINNNLTEISDSDFDDLMEEK